MAESSQQQDREGNEAYRAPRLALALSDFELLRTLGEGSVSHVVLARHRDSGREYAIKVIDKHFVLRNRLTGSIRLERKLLDTLSDPGIVRLEFTFQDEASLYLGLQCCPAGELFDQIARRGKLSLEDTRFYAAEIVLMLRYLRIHKVVHRDLKPENLLFDERRHLVLTDFGSAKDMSTPEAASSRDGGDLKGTADYISPEALHNEDVSYAADLWALGCDVFHMLSGDPPFRDRSEYLTMERVSSVDYHLADEYHPPEARDLIARLLVLRPSDRLGVDWDALRSSEAPQLLPAPEEPQEFNWELSQLASALPSFITGDDTGSPSLRSAAAALFGDTPKAGDVSPEGQTDPAPARTSADATFGLSPAPAAGKPAHEVTKPRVRLSSSSTYSPSPQAVQGGQQTDNDAGSQSLLSAAAALIPVSISAEAKPVDPRGAADSGS